MTVRKAKVKVKGQVLDIVLPRLRFVFIKLTYGALPAV